MYLNTLKAFRHDAYSSFGRAKDALFNIVDALLSEDRAKSFPELSLSPHFERQWPSLYEALEDGRIDHHCLQEVFARYLPPPSPEETLWIGIDTSGVARPQAVTSADRSAQLVHNLPQCQKAVTAGWQFSTVVALPETPSSWTSILSQQRVKTDTTPAQVAVAQMQGLMARLPEQTIRVLDRGYDALWL